MLLNIKKNQLNTYNLKILLISVLALFFPNLLLSHSENPLITITQIVEHPSIDAIREGALKALQDAGLKEEKILSGCIKALKEINRNAYSASKSA
jgi:putative ABC transport system substrate-binding protein